MKKTASFFFVFSFCFLSIKGFSQKISGVINNQEHVPLRGSTVSLLKAKDSSVVKLAISKDDGAFEFAGIRPADYLISVSNVGYRKLYTKVFNLAGQDVVLPAITMQKNSGVLGDVAVTGKKPFIEVKADKMILNIEGSINAIGNDVLDLLKKSPGVMVDKDDNLSLSGKNGVQVFIDGRPTPLGGQDLANYLKSLHSSQVETIEIITNPSAKYEAAGNAGIINIRLKKENNGGTNGSVNLNYNIGTYPKYSGGFSINHRVSKLNLFGSFNTNIVKAVNLVTNYRTVLDTLFDQTSSMHFNVHNYNYKTGVDYSVNKKSTLGVLLTGGWGSNFIDVIATSQIIYQPSKNLSRILRAGNDNEMKRHNINTNLNYSFVDGQKRNLSINVDYGNYDIDINQYQPNIYFDPTGTNELSRAIYRMISPSEINLYSLKTDYEQAFHKGKLSIGMKSSLAHTSNDFKRYDVFSSSEVLDKDRSNNFKYKENINAAYINYNKQYKGWNVQAGLRLENTEATGVSSGLRYNGAAYMAYDTSFKRHQYDLFPSAAISFNKYPKKQLTLSYSRRIDRPIYQDLNPFELKLDEYTYQKGNTNLRPQFTNSVGLNFLYNLKYNVTLNYSHIRDIIGQLIDTAEKSKVFVSKKNLAQQDIVSLSVSIPFQYKTFSSFLNINSYYSKYQADFGAGRKVDLDVTAAKVVFQNSLRFAKVWAAELIGIYSSPTIIQGTFKAQSSGGVDVGVQRQFWKSKGTLKLSVSDVFNTMYSRASSDFAGQYVRTVARPETRLFKVAFVYRFGTNKIKPPAAKKTGIEEEQNRIQ